MIEGSLLGLYGDIHFIAYARFTEKEQSVILINNNREEITKVFYLETIASSQANSLNNRIKGLLEGLEDNYSKGVFRTCTIVPLGTVTKAVTEKQENQTNEEAVIAALTTALTDVQSGRIRISVPDDKYNGQLVGKLIATPYNRECGYTSLNVSGAFTYNFSAAQVDTLRNMGVLFVQEEFAGESTQYRIHLGVNTAYAGNKADGLIKSRDIADELLREVKFTCLNYIKNEDVNTSRIMLQTDVDTIVQEFIDNRDVEEMIEDEGEIIRTELTVSIVDRYSALITGTILPVGEILQITVNTTIM